MSLTTLLKSPASKPLKAWLMQLFPNPGLGEKAPLLVPQADGKFAGAVGQAFDYLFRFHLVRRYPDLVKNGSDWVANTGYSRIMAKLANFPGEQVAIGFARDTLLSKAELSRIVTEEMAFAKMRYGLFLKDGLVTEELVRSCLFLAKLDLVVRAGFIDAQLSSHGSGHVDEVVAMIDIVPWEEFRAKRHCIVNPGFGKGSVMVGGADGDLIIDDWLCDLKSSKNYSLEREDLNQIVGYFLLSCIGGVNGRPAPVVNQVGMYFSRYGKVWRVNLRDRFSEAEWEVKVAEFRGLIGFRSPI